MPEACYLDHAATSRLLPEARDAMVAVLDAQVAGELGNASSLHHAGHHAKEIIEDARAAIARLINADPEEIIFTSGGSESNNTVMHIFAGQKIIVSDIEHPSVLEAARENTKSIFEVAASALASVDYEPREDGREEETTEKMTLYSFSLANNELGTIFDLPHEAGAYLHTDATQALGKIPIDVKALGVDYLTASAHKIGGPIGIGILYVKKGAPYKPLILGGHQEKGRRAGTSQVVNIAGFGAAARYALERKTWEIYESKIRPLRDLLEKRILAEIPHSRTNAFPGTKTLPHILNMSFAAAEGESIQLYLDLEGNIQVSTGSACASGDGKPSHVLMALTHNAEIAHSSIRFSLGLDTTEQDIDRVMTHLPGIIKKLQGISTIKIKEANE